MIIVKGNLGSTAFHKIKGEREWDRVQRMREEEHPLTLGNQCIELRIARGEVFTGDGSRLFSRYDTRLLIEKERKTNERIRNRELPR